MDIYIYVQKLKIKINRHQEALAALLGSALRCRGQRKVVAPQASQRLCILV
jgi:hypothetical protein